MSRFKYSIPHSTVGYRRNNVPALPGAAKEDWHSVIMLLLKLPLIQKGQEHIIGLSPDAATILNVFRSSVEARMRPGAEFSDIKDWANKLPGTVVRHAGLLHMAAYASEQRPWDLPISGEIMDAAVLLGEYFAAHALVAFGMIGADKHLQQAQDIWDAICRKPRDEDPPRISVRDLWQVVRRRFNRVPELEEVMETLDSMGYLQRRLSTRPGPGMKTVEYFISPVALERTNRTQNPRNRAAESDSVDSEDIVYGEGRGRKRVTV